MGKELPLAECVFGWGRVFRLYSDYLEVSGIPYALSALTRVSPTFRTALGVSSARLELWFGEKRVLLRGIASLEDARAVLEYLSSWCRQDFSLEQPTWPGSAGRGKRGSRSTVSLPTVPVPVRLLSGEQAYYSVVATLCGEPIGEADRVTYPARDQGTFILTNWRMIYIGRKSQVVIDFAHLLRVSRLRGAIAVQTDYRSRRDIFELRRPEECAQYLETILERYEQENRQSEPEYSTEEHMPEEEGWAATSAAHMPETLVDEGDEGHEDEIETDGLTRRSWRIERMRTLLRDTEDFQEGRQEQHVGLASMVADKREMGERGEMSMDRVDRVDMDMVPDGVVEILSREGEA